MAHFYAEIQGSRGLASRLGHKNSGIWGHIRGWSNGVEVQGVHTEEGEDVFHITVTTGSGYGGHKKYIGSVHYRDNEPVWIPAE